MSFDEKNVRIQYCWKCLYEKSNKTRETWKDLCINVSELGDELPCYLCEKHLSDALATLRCAKLKSGHATFINYPVDKDEEEEKRK